MWDLSREMYDQIIDDSLTVSGMSPLIKQPRTMLFRYPMGNVLRGYRPWNAAGFSSFKKSANTSASRK